jgi:hypothetical protein
VEPTFRHLRLGEALPGQFVENIGETKPALDHPPRPDRLLYAGHPGRVDRDYEDGLGGHVVVIWHGLEDAEESSTGAGHNPDPKGDYFGLGWLDEATYTDRVRRLTAGEDPIAG